MNPDRRILLVVLFEIDQHGYRSTRSSNVLESYCCRRDRSAGRGVGASSPAEGVSTQPAAK